MTNQDLEARMSGRMMLARLAGATSFIGRAVFFLSTIAAGGMMAFGAVLRMCSATNGVQELSSMIASSTLLLIGAFFVLAIFSTISWIITGLGSLVSFGIYLLARLGTFFIAMALAVLVMIIDLRYVAGGCELGVPFNIVGLGLGLLMVGACVQVGAMLLINAYNSWSEKLVRRPEA